MATTKLTASDALRDLERALRIEDRPGAAELLRLAAENDWTEVTAAATIYVDHHPRCPADRIEIVDHSTRTRPGEPGWGVVTTHCIDCAAHRAHDAAGLPLLPQAGIADDDIVMQNQKRRSTTGRA